ncbi:MAG: DMT family transporter [Acidobacteria bacterium]|nr:DMT family transporter [Acidobacteriota bacterium]
MNTMLQPHAHSPARAYAGAIFAVTVWGASFIATKIGVREVSPFTVMWLRFGIGVAVLAVAVAARGEFARPGRRDLLYFAGLGALGITLHQWLQATGLVTAQASTTSWIISATPLTMAVVGRIVLGERMTGRQLAGIALGAVGVLLVVSRGDWASIVRGSAGSVGDALVATSTVTWALFSVYSRRGLRRHRSAPMMLYVMASGWLLGSIPWLALGGPAELARLTPDAWTGIAFLGVLCSGLAYIFWYDALRALPAANVGALLYIEPLVTMAVAALLLGEAVTLPAIAGGAIILAGVRVATRRVVPVS